MIGENSVNKSTREKNKEKKLFQRLFFNLFKKIKLIPFPFYISILVFLLIVFYKQRDLINLRLRRRQ